MLPSRRGGRRNYSQVIGVPIIVIFAACASCSRYPIASVAAAERANQLALQAEAPRYCAAEYQRYQATLQSARELLAEQQERWVIRRYGAAVELLEQARELAEQAADRATEKRAARRLGVEGQLREFEQALEMIRDGTAGIDQQAAMRRRLAKAEISLATAKSQWESGNYDAAHQTLGTEAAAVRFLTDAREAFVARNTDSGLLSEWNKSVKATIDKSAQTGAHALIVNKYRKTLSVYRSGRRIAEYPADLGSNPFSEKRHQGDRATPEGRYRVVKKLGAGQSVYYKALVINYPNEQDRERYRQLKRHLPTAPGVGGQIEIHGRGGRNENWTAGCVAVDDRVMDLLLKIAKIGTPVTIVANESIQESRQAGERD